jgi:polyisoprenoid-binding protein YceI
VHLRRDANPLTSEVTAIIDMTSTDTANAVCDEHLGTDA